MLLSHRRPDRFLAITKSQTNALRRPTIRSKFRPHGSRHSKRGNFRNRRIPPTRLVVVVYNSILDSNVWNFQQTLKGSKTCKMTVRRYSEALAAVGCRRRQYSLEQLNTSKPDSSAKCWTSSKPNSLSANPCVTTHSHCEA